MLFQSIFILASGFFASAMANSDLCLQGCCGLAFKLPSTSLTLHHLTVDKSSIQVPLKAPELPCCPCDDQVVLQPESSPDGAANCPDRLPCNNETTCSPALPAIPKPKGPTASPKAPTDPCAECQCWDDCECGSDDGCRLLAPAKLFAIPKQQVSLPESKVGKNHPCAEGVCESWCECSTSKLLAFINPDADLASMPRVCGPRECSSDCICRDDLIKATRVVASLKNPESSTTFVDEALVGKSEL